MSFKYRLILFYILVEIFFITLIVGVNFNALIGASNKLTNEKIESSTSFIEELVKVPLSVYDLATLDNIVEKVTSIKDIDALMIFDNQNNFISGKNSYKNLSEYSVEEFDKDYEKELRNNKHLMIKKEIYEENVFLGSFGILFDMESSNEFIDENRNKTLVLIIIEILISFIVSYYVGNKLTNMLKNLSDVAKEIGEDKNPEIPYLEMKDEIGTLSKSMDKMKKDLKTRNDNIIEMQKQKDSFFANMSHELKTPLNAINVISSVMLHNKNNELDQLNLKNINIINKCGNDLLVLINDILDISKLEAGEIKLNCENFNFKIFIDGIIHLFENMANEKDIKLDCKVDDSLEYIYNDEVRIKQIIINLLSNAVKFTEHGTIDLSVKDLGENIEIGVKDNGIGIPQNKLETIFERFKQVDDTTSRKYGGTGLGLAICKELSYLLNGNIKVKSILKEGSTFILTIQKNFSKTDLKNNSNQLIEENKNDKLIDTSLNDKNYIENENILLLNKDIVSFMSIAVELKRKAKKLFQVHDLYFFKEELRFNKYDIIIVNLKSLDQDDVYEILKNKKFKTLIVITEKEELSENMKNIATLVYASPINKSEFLEKILSL